MPNLTVTMLLVACACSLAVLQVFGRESRNRHKAGSSISRITKFGWIRIILAAATLLLIALNEYEVRQSHEEFSRAARETQDQLHSRIEVASRDLQLTKDKMETIQSHSGGIIELIVEREKWKRRSEGLESVLSDASVQTDHFDIPLSDLISDRQHSVSTIVGREVSVEKGSLIHWSVDCSGHLNSAVEQQTVTDECSLDGLGTFQAYSQRLPMKRLIGTELLQGTRSNDGQFLFRTGCHKIHDELKKAQCTINVTVTVPALSKFYHEDNDSKPMSEQDLDRMTEDLARHETPIVCRIFEELSGKSCQARLKAFLRERGF